MGNLEKKVIGNLGDPRLPYDFSDRECGTIPTDTTRPHFRWVSEVAYKNAHRIVARGYDTTELVEQGYGLVDMLFIDFQSRIPLIEENKMLHYVLILALEDGLSMPAAMSRIVGRAKTFLTQACGASILAFGHAYGAFSAFGNMLMENLAQMREDGKTMKQVALELAQERLGDPALGVSDLMLQDPAAKRIFARAKKLNAAGEYIAFTEEIVKAAQQISDHPVDLDMLGAIGAATLDLGFSPDAIWSIIAVTRSFGAGAHYIEEVEREGVTRLGQELTPQECYDGPADRPVPPLAERDQVARPAQTYTPQEWKDALEERKKLRGSGFAIEEEIEAPRRR